MEIELDGETYSAVMDESYLRDFGLCSFDFRILITERKRKWFGFGAEYTKQKWKSLHPNSSAMIDSKEFLDIRCSPSIVKNLLVKHLKHLLKVNKEEKERWQTVEQVYNIVNNDEPA